MFNIYENTNLPASRPLIATAETFEEAKAKILARDESAFIEDDSDYVGCADAYLPRTGRLMAIEPKGFNKDSSEWVANKRAQGKALADERRAAMESFDAEFLR